MYLDHKDQFDDVILLELYKGVNVTLPVLQL